MSLPRLQRFDSQGGYTLIEVIIATALGALLMGALISVILTTTRATEVATSRVEASSQIRNFEYSAYEDFAGSNISDLPSGCTSLSPCKTSAITLSGIDRASPDQTYRVTYTWDPTNQWVNRQVGTATTRAATNVKDFWWYVDANQTVVVGLNVTVGAYSDVQTFRFYPRRNP